MMIAVNTTKTPETDEYFGGCPECGKCEDCLNVHASHWHVCHTHRVRWCVGWNLFSSWKDESQLQWEVNESLLIEYREVKPVRANMEPEA